MHLKARGFLYLFMLVHCACLAQEPIIFNGQPKLGKAVNIIAQTYFYEDTSGDTLSFAAIKKQPFIPLPKEYMQFKATDRPLIVNWLKFSIKNTNLTDTLKLVFNCNSHALVKLYTNKQPVNREFTFEQVTTDSVGMQLTVPPGTINTYYVRVIEYVRYIMPLSAELHTPTTYLQEYHRQSSNSAYLFLIMGIALGSLFFMGIYTCYQFLLTHDRVMAYYTVYIFYVFYVGLIITGQRFSLQLFDPFKKNFDAPLSGIAFFYALFIASILEIPRNFPNKWKVLQVILGFIVIEALLEIIEKYRGSFIFNSNTYYLYINNLPIIVMNLYLIYLILISKGQLKKYLLTGIISLFSLLFVFMNFSFFISINDISPGLKMIVNYPPVWGTLGVVIEAICFAFALAYRSKLVQDEKNQLQNNYAGQLEKELNQRTLKIQEQNSLLETQKIHQMETVFEKKLAETEMTALRAQMNPHFIFNCLNSIKLYMLENDSETASAYLTTFSRLIRLVLENSRSEKVTLENEVETLRLYIQLEVMRFKDKVNYQINIDSNVDLPYIEVPPLLLQPYVENAIWHGLMHKEFGGMVIIAISQPNEHLLHVEITDDGVGREKAAEYKSKSIIKHKSFGLKMTKERIQMFNQLYYIKTEVKLVDLVDDEGKTCGTKVVINIPV